MIIPFHVWAQSGVPYAAKVDVLLCLLNFLHVAVDPSCALSWFEVQPVLLGLLIHSLTSCLSKSKLHFKEVFAGTAKGCAGTYPWCWPRVGQWSHSKFSTYSCHPLCACFDRSIESSVDPHLKLLVFPFRDFSLASINTFFTLNHMSRKMFLSNMLFL